MGLGKSFIGFDGSLSYLFIRFSRLYLVIGKFKENFEKKRIGMKSKK